MINAGMLHGGACVIQLRNSDPEVSLGTKYEVTRKKWNKANLDILVVLFSARDIYKIYECVLCFRINCSSFWYYVFQKKVQIVWTSNLYTKKSLVRLFMYIWFLTSENSTCLYFLEFVLTCVLLLLSGSNFTKVTEAMIKNFILKWLKLTRFHAWVWKLSNWIAGKEDAVWSWTCCFVGYASATIYNCCKLFFFPL